MKEARSDMFAVVRPERAFSQLSYTGIDKTDRAIEITDYVVGGVWP
jgi:hypothetical protein